MTDTTDDVALKPFMAGVMALSDWVTDLMHCVRSASLTGGGSQFLAETALFISWPQDQSDSVVQYRQTVRVLRITIMRLRRMRIRQWTSMQLV